MWEFGEVHGVGFAGKRHGAHGGDTPSNLSALYLSRILRASSIIQIILLVINMLDGIQFEFQCSVPSVTDPPYQQRSFHPSHDKHKINETIRLFASIG